jgi:hypothetical protein
MDFNAASAKGLLERFDFTTLFVNELGWDRHSAALPVEISSMSYMLKAVAEKRGMVAWLCDAPAGQSIPDRATRKKIERQVAKTTLEHLIVFTDGKRAEQIWCWARREAGRPASVPEHFWYASSGNRGFLQKLAAIAFSLEEEESLTLVDVTTRARAAFDVERVTKRFYDQFKTEHKAFLDFINGIADVADREWYASLMLNRLMFIYFMQRKGFLNGDRDYLRNRLERSQKEKGRDKFYSFYNYFLRRLFHEGLGGKKRNPELEKLLGRIPYLNGGLFEPHPIEEQYPKIAIPDEAFTRIFAYFDRYQWHLDERPLRNQDEINPDVLGYIFEKYINQKQMGAYYTKEDITEYISKSAVIPFLLDATKAKCKVAFENPSGPTVWDHLRDDPDRYIYAAVKHGVECPLPAEIAAGIDDVSARTSWNRAGPSEFALPTEIWREVVARRTRYAELRAKLAAGEVREINDLITLNLDVRQFAQDVIERCEGPDLLRAFWKAIEGATILDPTCGSGAFLFAALNILEPLYETCLQRMEAFVADLERSGAAQHPKKFEDFKAVLTKVGAHPNARYFILKNTILNNLFGVDIMEEAVEICKLRLFLKLAAQVDPDPSHPNLGIEPLPDIDFNIRAGNTLVGYATYDDVKAALSSKLDLDNVAERIARGAADLQQASDVFRARQMEGDGSILPADKATLRQRLKQLDEQLNKQLATEYGVGAKDTAAYGKWLKSHEPFHWFTEFHGIIKSGGFGVVLGNPPYISSSSIRKVYTARGYATEQCPDIYAWIMERCTSLLSIDGRFGMIVPLSLTFSGGFQSLRSLLLERFGSNWFSSFARIPAALFSADVRVRNTIHVGSRRGQNRAYTTSTHRWFEEARPHLVQKIQYAEFTPSLWDGLIPKLSQPALLRALQASKRESSSLERYRSTRPSRQRLYFRKSAYNWVSFSLEPAPCYDASGKRISASDSGEISFDSARIRDLAHTLLNGKIGLLWWAIVGDDFHVTLSNFVTIPFPVERLATVGDTQIEASRAVLESAMQANLVFKLNAGKRIGNYNLAKCRDTSDRSDMVWRDAFCLQDVWGDVDLAYAQLVKTDFSEKESDEGGDG